MSKFLTLDGLSHFLSKIKGIFVGAATGTTENHVVTFGADGKTIKDSGYTIASNVPSNAKFTDTTYTVATASKDGLMAKADKSKLDGVETGADVNLIESVKVNGTALDISSKAVNIDLSSYATTASLSSYAKASALSDYAKKTDIANVYIYKGTVSAYSELPTSATVGWVYNVETADDSNGIKAGDNVAWNGSTWDNLSGILELGISEITDTEIDTLFT